MERNTNQTCMESEKSIKKQPHIVRRIKGGEQYHHKTIRISGAFPLNNEQYMETKPHVNSFYCGEIDVIELLQRFLCDLIIIYDVTRIRKCVMLLTN